MIFTYYSVYPGARVTTQLAPQEHNDDGFHHARKGQKLSKEPWLIEPWLCPDLSPGLGSWETYKLPWFWPAVFSPSVSDSLWLWGQWCEHWAPGSVARASTNTASIFGIVASRTPQNTSRSRIIIIFYT